MGNIIEFKNTKVDDETKNKLKEIFDNLELDISDFIKNNKDLICESFLDLFYSFQVIKQKQDNNKWLGLLIQEKILNNINEVTKEDDKYNKYSLELVYLYLIDITKGKILKTNNEYIRLIISSLVEAEDINIKEYKKIVDGITNLALKKEIESIPSTKNQKISMLESIDDIINGKGIDEIITYLKQYNTESSNVEILDLDEGIITINKIYNYYMSQIGFFYNYDSDDFKIDYIDKILLLNNLDNASKNKYIEILKTIRDFKKNLIFELNSVSSLTELFLYLKDNISMYDLEKLKSIFYYKTINQLGVKDAVDKLEGKKM